MKKILFAIFTLLLYSCTSNPKCNNCGLVERIDKMKVSETAYEIEADSAGNVLDTLSVTKYKLSDDDKIAYKECIADGFTTKEYFNDEGDLRYSETTTETGLFIVYSAIEEDGEIQYALNVEHVDDKPSDTIRMDYEYFYRDDKSVGKIIISCIKDSIALKNITILNRAHQPLSQVIIQNSDTVSKSSYKYRGEILRVKTVYDMKKHVRTGVVYDSNGYIAEEKTTSRDGTLLLKKTFSINEKGKVITRKEWSPGRTKYIVYDWVR